MRLYRLLAKAFPREFRAQYEAELEAAAVELLRAEGPRGRFHRARLWMGLAADAVARGWSERRATRARGHLGRAMRGELRQAVRALASRPATAAIIVGLLGLAMGANAAVFGVVDAALLRSLPYAEPDQLVLLWERFEPMHLETMPWSDADYLDVRAATAFAGTAVFRSRRFVLTGRGEPATLRAMAVEGTLFDLVGITAARGRLFTRAESDAGRDDLVVLSHTAWAGRFGSDPSIVGQTILLDNQPRTVVAVLAPGVSFPPPITFSGQMLSTDPDVYVPYKISTAATPAARGAHGSFVIARLTPGATLTAARAEVAAIGARLEREFPDSNSGIKTRVDSLHGQAVVTIRTALYLLLAAVGGVLLIACASISNVMLARASGRSREMALRAALGASRASLIRQLLFESLLLGAAGMAVGLLAARWLASLLVAINPIELPSMFQSSLDWRVMGFSMGIMLVAVCAFGLVPALAGSRFNLNAVLRSADRSVVRVNRRTKSALVVLQVSLAVVLLVGSGVVVRSLLRLWSVDPGFEPGGVVVTNLSLPSTRYGTPSLQREFQNRWIARLQQIPGVRRAAALTMLPFAFDKSSSDYTVIGEPARKTGDYLIATYDFVTPGVTEVLRMPLVEGRALSDGDTDTAPLVVVVSQALARRHWPAGRAVGHQLTFGGEHEIPKTIVGVVADVRMEGFDSRLDAMIYVPQAQSPVPASWVAVASDRPVEALAAEMRAALGDIDSGLPLGRVRPLADIMGDTVKKPRFTALVLTAFAIAALLIAAIGLYGVLAFDVAQQRRELGIRLALGATPAGIRAVVLGRGFKLVALGLVVGAAASLPGSRLLAGLLFEPPAIDVVALLTAAATLAVAAFAATWLPAQRATKADPIEALRSS